jgi:hypothetical protein
MEMLVKTSNGTELREVEEMNRDPIHPGLWREIPVLRPGERTLHGVDGTTYVVQTGD